MFHDGLLRFVFVSLDGEASLVDASLVAAPFVNEPDALRMFFSLRTEP